MSRKVNQMWRLRVAWGGSGVVGPGLSTFYAVDDSPGFPAAVRAFFSGLSTALPTNVTITVPNGGDVINPSTGALTNTWTQGSPPAAVTGTGAGAYAAGVGVQVRWKGVGVTAGRRRVGSTFIVPVVSPVFGTNGQVTDATLASFVSASNTFLTAMPGLVVWTRPRAAYVSKKGVSHPAVVGTTSIVASADWPRHPSWLTSRRR